MGVKLNNWDNFFLTFGMLQETDGGVYELWKYGGKCSARITTKVSSPTYLRRYNNACN